MSDQPDAGSLAPSEVRTSLRIIAQLLRDADHLEPETQQALADLVDELAGALAANTLPSAEVAHLAESTAHLAEAIHQQHEPGVLSAARDRLQRAIVAAEAQAPNVSGVARRLLDALSNLGI